MVQEKRFKRADVGRMDLWIPIECGCLSVNLDKRPRAIWCPTGADQADGAVMCTQQLLQRIVTQKQATSSMRLGDGRQRLADGVENMQTSSPRNFGRRRATCISSKEPCSSRPDLEEADRVGIPTSKQDQIASSRMRNQLPRYAWDG